VLCARAKEDSPALISIIKLKQIVISARQDRPCCVIVSVFKKASYDGHIAANQRYALTVHSNHAVILQKAAFGQYIAGNMKRLSKLIANE
jgi:hypothetical protein